MNIGRNGLCPCGSGSKYKQCCLQKDLRNRSAVYEDAEWLKFRQAEGEVEAILDQYVEDHYLASERPLAWDYFKPDDASPLPSKALKLLFQNWFYYNWELKDDLSIARQALLKEPMLFTDYQKRVMEATLNSPFSIFLVKEVVPGLRMVVKDFFQQNELVIKEAQGTFTIKAGDLIYGRAVTLDEQSIVIGFGPWVIPNRFFDTVLDFRDGCREELSVIDFELRDLYYYIIEETMRPPVMTNHHGDVVILNEIFYELKCHPKEVFDALMPLSCQEDFHWNEKLSTIEFPWVTTQDPTGQFERLVLGSLTLTPDQLHVATNSNQRAAKIKEEIALRLGSKVALKEHKTINLSNPEELMKMKERLAPSEPLKLTPEMLAAAKAQSDAYWKKWLDTKLPILGNLTPREATLSDTGRERLEALLLDFDEDAEDSMNLMRPNTRYLRAELGV